MMLRCGDSLCRKVSEFIAVVVGAENAVKIAQICRADMMKK
jgi:hypothetical protein